MEVKDLSLPNPLLKHAVAEAVRKHKNSEEPSGELWERILVVLNDTNCRDTEVSIPIHGQLTTEYALIPCDYVERDKSLQRILYYLRGKGYYADIFRVSKEVSPVSCGVEYAMLICWDPQVLYRTTLARYFRLQRTGDVLCSECSVREKCGAIDCPGCDMLRVWLPSVVPLVSRPDPCSTCVLAKSGQTCTGCAFKRLWDEVHAAFQK